MSDADERDLSGMWLRALAAMLVLGVLAPFVLVDWPDNMATPLNVLLGMAIVLIGAVRLSGVLGSGKPDLFRAFFYVFVFVFMGVAALAQVVAGAYPMDGRSYAHDTVTDGLLAVLVGIAGYELGWYLYRRRAPRTATDGATVRWYFSPSRTVLVGVLGLIAVSYQISRYGIAAFLTSRSETIAILAGRDADSSPFYNALDKTSGLLTIFLTQVPVFAALFIILYCRHHRLWAPPRSMATDALWRTFILVLIAANVVINNPIGNGRFWSCLVVVAFISIYVSYTRVSGVRAYVGFALVILLFLFTALDAFRNTGDPNFDVAGPRTGIVSDATYSMFQMELNGVEFVEREGHTAGRQMLGTLLAFVPRGLWENKPGPTGQLVDPQYVRSATAWTEFQVDFGITGVLLLFALYGAASAALTVRGVNARPGLLHAAVPLLAVFQLFLLRGSLLPAAVHLYQLVAVFALTIAVRRITASTGISHREVAGGRSGRTCSASTGERQVPASQRTGSTSS
ncbi:MAG: O-antigen polymerase [Pseudonocardia sp.]